MLGRFMFAKCLTNCLYLSKYGIDADKPLDTGQSIVVRHEDDDDQEWLMAKVCSPNAGHWANSNSTHRFCLLFIQPARKSGS